MRELENNQGWKKENIIAQEQEHFKREKAISRKRAGNSGENKILGKDTGRLYLTVYDFVIFMIVEAKSQGVTEHKFVE